MNGPDKAAEWNPDEDEWRRMFGAELESQKGFGVHDCPNCGEDYVFERMVTNDAEAKYVEKCVGVHADNLMRYTEGDGADPCGWVFAAPIICFVEDMDNSPYVFAPQGTEKGLDDGVSGRYEEVING